MQSIDNFNRTHGSNFKNQQIPPFLAQFSSSNPCKNILEKKNNDPCENICANFNLLLSIEKPTPVEKIEPISKITSLEKVNTTYKYPFESEKDLKNYLMFSDLVEKIYNEVISGDNVLFTDMYLPVKTQKGGKIYNDSFKIYKNGDTTIKVDIIPGVELTQVYDKRLEKSRYRMLCRKQFSDKMTDLVNSEKILNDINIENIARYQYLINTFFTLFRDKYIQDNKLEAHDVIFMYKGGTTMKILYNEYGKILDDIPQFKNNIKNFFNRSDSDYSFLINPNIDENKFNMIYYHFSKISIVGLKYIKKILIDNKNFFINIQKLTNTDLEETINKFNIIINGIRDKYKKALLGDTEELDEMKLAMDCEEVNNIEKIIGISLEGNNQMKNRTLFTENIPNNFELHKLMIDTEPEIENKTLKDKIFLQYKEVPSARRDFYVTKNDITKMGNILLGPIKYNDIDNATNDNNLYLTSNETVFFTGPVKNQVSFLLSRIKYNFVFYYKSVDGKYGYFNAPSEIVDLSISKKLAYDLQATYKNVTKKINSYKYIFKENTLDELVVKYYGLSIPGFINDFIKILYYEYDLPWKADKYTKRIYRVLFFIYIEFLTENKIYLLDNILRYFDTKSYDDVENKKNYNILKQNLQNTGTLEFLELYEERVRLRHLNLPTQHDKDSYNELLNILLDTFREFKQEGKLNTLKVGKDESGAIQVHHLGGYYNKYKKYLYKYRNLLELIEKNQ